MGWVLKFSGESPRAKARLGEMYSLMRRWAADNEVAGIREKYEIHRTVKWGLDTLLYGEGEICIGENTYLGRDCFVVSHPSGAKIQIGKNCAISHNVHIRTSRNDKEFNFDHPYESSSLNQNINIGDSVLIGANVFIREGVTIGDCSIVGANSVVTSNVPSNTVYGGVPARPLRPKLDCQTGWPDFIDNRRKRGPEESRYGGR
jgi:maltose O-acetyltransferase